MLYKNLTYDEKYALFKCILRFHKEKGTFASYKKLGNFDKFFFFNNNNNFFYVRDFLITLVWCVIRNHAKENNNGDINNAISIKASIAQLEFIDYLPKEKNIKFVKICREIATNEFSFINNIIINSSAEQYNEFKNKINYLWDEKKRFVDYSEASVSEFPLK